MIDALKPLLESGLLNEETRDAINAAWQSKLDEARGEIRQDIRQEFADRYAHDKKTMTEALNKMINTELKEEIVQIRQERNAAAKTRVKTVKEMKAMSKTFSNFLTRNLAKELVEFKQDKASQKAALKTMENFLMHTLAEEITEFDQDKKALANTRVKLVTEAKKQITGLKDKFKKRAAKKVTEFVTKAVTQELSQLREDINAAKKNTLGRRIYEAYEQEFTASHLNENQQIRKMQRELTKKEQQLSEARQTIARRTQLVEAKDKEISNIKQNDQRKKIVSELLNPLSNEKKEVMCELLENVQTDRLRTAYDKYLPAVLNNSKASIKPKVLTEQTGNRAARNTNGDSAELSEMRRLAGLTQ